MRYFLFLFLKKVVLLIFSFTSVYVELADQYKVMDAVSDVPRRNMLARHLREVVDILEQKVSFSLLIFSQMFFTSSWILVVLFRETK